MAKFVAVSLSSAFKVGVGLSRWIAVYVHHTSAIVFSNDPLEETRYGSLILWLPYECSTITTATYHLMLEITYGRRVDQDIKTLPGLDIFGIIFVFANPVSKLQ